MDCKKGSEVVTCVRQVLQEACDSYLKHPYRFLRESDLVCHLVGKLQKRLGESWTDGSCLPEVQAGDKGGRKFTVLSASEKKEQLFTSRVRTEAKLNESSQNRTDIAILQSQTMTIRHHGAGVRDVVLDVEPNEVTALIEVKLYPSTYVRKSSADSTAFEHGWLDDLFEVNKNVTTINETNASQNITEKTTGHLIFLDTSIPIEGKMLRKLTDRPFKKNTNTHSALEGLLAKGGNKDWCFQAWGGNGQVVWPLPAADFVLKAPTFSMSKDGEVTHEEWRVEFRFLTEDSKAVEDDTLFLHGLGVCEYDEPRVCMWAVRILESC